MWSNPGELTDDANCVNANASQIKADAEVEKKKAEEQTRAALAAILAVMAANPDLAKQDETRRVAAKQDIGTIKQALMLYPLDNGLLAKR